MPTPAAKAALINAVHANTANGRVTAVTATEQRAGFQALLEIGAEMEAQKKRREEQERGPRQENIAAPAAADVNAAHQPSPIRKPSDTDHDAHVRAYENNNKDRRPLAEERGDDRPAAVTRPESKDGVALRPTLRNNDSEEAGAQGEGENEELLSDLRDRIETLNRMLELFASLGGNPQVVQTRVDTVLLQVSTITVTAGVSTEALQGSNQQLGDLLGDILARLQQLASGTEATPDALAGTKIDFFSLLRDIRQLASRLDGEPEAAPVVAAQREPLSQAVQDLIRRYTQFLDNAVDAEAQADTAAVTVVKAEGAEKSAIKQPVTDLAPQIPVQRTDSTVFAAVAAAPATASVATGTNTRAGDQNGNNQLPPQAIGTVRNANQTQAPAATNAPSFEQLLRQAKTPVMEQVIVNIRTAENKSNIKIQLEPEELGKLEIKMHVAADGKTGVSITAENKNTLDLLQRDSRGLERALADAGLRADSGSLSFNLRGGQQENNANQSFAQSYRNPMEEEPEQVLAPVVSRSYLVNMTDGLDLTV